MTMGKIIRKMLLWFLRFDDKKIGSEKSVKNKLTLWETINKNWKK